MRNKLIFPIVAVSLLALSACGNSPGCRAVTGAGIGAAGGAVGGLTSPNQINAGPAPCN